MFKNLIRALEFAEKVENICSLCCCSSWEINKSPEPGKYANRYFVWCVHWEKGLLLLSTRFDADSLLDIEFITSLSSLVENLEMKENE